MIKIHTSDQILRRTLIIITDETTGGTDDWAKARAGVKYTFCPELRGRDFVVNRSQIEPSFRELWNGIYAMVNQIARQG